MSEVRSMPLTKQRRLLDALYEGQADLTDLAAQERLSLLELAAWANELATMHALDGLCRLNDVRAQLLISRYRTLAAAQLFELTQAESPGEIARKACVDLLRTSLVDLDARRLSTASGAETRAADDEDEGSTTADLHALLAAIGMTDASHTEEGGSDGRACPVGDDAS